METESKEELDSANSFCECIEALYRSFTSNSFSKELIEVFFQRTDS
jgi:hypothetical protein